MCDIQVWLLPAHYYYYGLPAQPFFNIDDNWSIKIKYLPGGCVYHYFWHRTMTNSISVIVKLNISLLTMTHMMVIIYVHTQPKIKTQFCIVALFPQTLNDANVIHCTCCVAGLISNCTTWYTVQALYILKGHVSEVSNCIIYLRGPPFINQSAHSSPSCSTAIFS